MNISTKLILLLTLTVAVVMFLASFLSLHQRESALENALRDELRAHAVTLQIALEENYSGGDAAEARRLIDRLRENSRVYAVLLFDDKANLLTLSQPSTDETFRRPPELSTVLQNGDATEITRVIEGQKFFSLILPLQISENRRGALEIVKPLALIQDDISRSRVNWFSTTLLLLAVILLVVVLVLRRSLSLPLNELLKAARAVGRGDLSYRVEFSKEKRDEISLLANEFNRMADNLAEQKRTAEREAENRLELERQLRHSERLAAVGRLAAGIAHEFGAPLNVIDARAEQLINKRELPPEKQTKNLRIIREQTNRISHIVHQLLNLARPYNFHLSTVNLTKSLRDTLEQIEQNAVDCSVEIDFLDADNEYKIAADEDFLRQVWLNIFQNALQAMLRGGKLIVNCVHEKIDQKHFVAVRICDSGTGIAPEHLDKIFDAFYTTKDIGKGTGLGLAVARRIIEEHGGNIEAANSEQGGAIFTVRLPLLTTENEWTKKF